MSEESKRFPITWVLVLRRLTQLGIIVLFWLAAHRGVMLLSGNYSSSLLLDTVPLSDPFAVLQMLVAGMSLMKTALIGAAIVAAVYVIFGGRVFCSWVCPVNLISDTASWLRRKLKIGGQYKLSTKIRYWVLGLALLLSFIKGVAAFEWISPIGMIHRELIYTAGAGLLLIPLLLFFDLFVVRNGWCGHLCPLGAFYGLLGRFSILRIGFDPERCTDCKDCVRICPEPQVIQFDEMSEKGMILSGECTNCARCLEVCATDAYHLTTRFKLKNKDGGPK